MTYQPQPCEGLNCDRMVLRQRSAGRPPRFCKTCQEHRNRVLSRMRWANRCEKKLTVERGDDLTAAEIEAKLAAGDAERKRTRQQCGRRTA